MKILFAVSLTLVSALISPAAFGWDANSKDEAIALITTAATEVNKTTPFQWADDVTVVETSAIDANFYHHVEFGFAPELHAVSDFYHEYICNLDGFLPFMSKWGATSSLYLVDTEGNYLGLITVKAQSCQDPDLRYSFIHNPATDPKHIYGESRSTSSTSTAASASSRQTTSTELDRQEPSSEPTYREEYVNGEQYQVAAVNGIEVWAQAQCWNSSCNKIATYVFIQNGSDQTFTVVPETDIQLRIGAGQKQMRVPAFSPAEWVKKQQNKAEWNAILAGAAAGLANSGPTGSFSGTYSDSYGGGSYYGTYTDNGANAERAARMGASFGRAIEDAFNRKTVDLFQAETLSPGEATGGRIHFHKFKQIQGFRNEARLTVSVGSGSDKRNLQFAWSVN